MTSNKIFMNTEFVKYTNATSLGTKYAACGHEGLFPSKFVICALSITLSGIKIVQKVSNPPIDN